MDKGHILIVDDVGFNRILLERGLTSAGYRVDQASGGIEALKLLSRNRYDLAITDLMMPDVDGLQILDRVRSSRFADDSGLIPPPPFLLCTAHLGEEITTQAAEHGFFGVLAKPIDREKLLEVVEKAIKRLAEPIQLMLDITSSTTLETLQQRLTARPDEIARTLFEVLSGCDFPDSVKSLSGFEAFLANGLGVDMEGLRKKQEQVSHPPVEKPVESDPEPLGEKEASDSNE